MPHLRIKRGRNHVGCRTRNEEFADDRLNGQEADELLEDAGSKALLEIALDRLVDRGTILAYNLHDGDATIICDL